MAMEDFGKKPEQGLESDVAEIAEAWNRMAILERDLNKVRAETAALADDSPEKAGNLEYIKQLQTDSENARQIRDRLIENKSGYSAKISQYVKTVEGQKNYPELARQEYRKGLFNLYHDLFRAISSDLGSLRLWLKNDGKDQESLFKNQSLKTGLSAFKIGHDTLANTFSGIDREDLLAVEAELLKERSVVDSLVGISDLNGQSEDQLAKVLPFLKSFAG